MTVIDSKKLLPPSKSSGSALDTQKFLVPVSNIKAKSSAIVKASDITPDVKEGGDNKKTLLGEVIQIRKNVISIQKIIGDNNLIFKKTEERKRKLLERERFEKKEKKLETKDSKQKASFSIPSLPRTGFLDAIKRFLFFTLLGAAFVKFGKHIPKIVEFSKKLIPAFKFLEDFTGNFLNGVVDFVGAGYKAYDKVRELTKQVGGEDLEKKFDEFSKQFNTFANLSLIAGMSTMGGEDPFRDRRFNRPSRRGFDRTGRRVSQSAQARYASRYGKQNFLQRFGKKNIDSLGDATLRLKPQQSATQKFVQKGVTNIAGKRVGALAGRLPIVGPLIDFGIRKFIFNEPLGKAAAGAVGAAVGQSIGTWIGAAGATALAASSFGLGALAAPALIAGGAFLGGLLGDLIGTSLYSAVSGGEKPVGKSKGGQVTRGGKKVSGPARRTIRAVRTRPPKIKPQKTIPGKDVGGKEQIKKLFPSPTDPNQRNPLGVLETTSKNLKEIPLLGGIMGASIDLTMGQKPDPSVFKKISIGFGSLVQSAIDAETSNTIGNIQKEIVGLAGGGAVPRTLSTNENIGMKIGERLARTLEVMVNSKVTETLQSIRQQFGKEGFGLTEPDGGPGGPGGIAGGEYGGFAPGGIQKEIYEYLINEKKMSDVQALGLMANISRESGFRPGILSGDDGGAGGLFQWKIPRSTAMVKAVPDWKTNWKGQIDYALREPGEKGPQYLSTTFSSAQEAADWWMREWERPADKVAASKKHAEYLKTVPKAPDGSVKFRGASSLRVSSGNFDIVQYITGDVNYRGDGKQFYYDRPGHGMPGNYHDHIAFRTVEEKERAKAALRAAGIKLGSEYRPGDPGYHGKGLAIDVPGSQWGGSGQIGEREYSGSKKVREVLGLSPFEDGGKVGGLTRAILGEKGPEFVLDADTTAALEQNYPGFLSELNKADYKGALRVLQNYADYYNPSKSSTLMLQRVVVEKPVPVPMGGGGGFVPIDSNSTSPSTSALSIG